jgi:dienelactone hydrolase
VERSAGVLLLVDGAQVPGLVDEARAHFEHGGRRVLAPELERADWDSDRGALRALGARADAWRESGQVDPDRLAVVGFGRGGTLAFLLGCAQRFEAVVDVDGPVLHPELGPERPTQPLELALNLEGAFLGAFGRTTEDQELELLRQRLTAAARPFELERHAGAADASAWRAAGLLERASAFLDALDG